MWRASMNGAVRRHWSNNLTLTPTPEGVTASVYLMLVDIGVKPAQIASTGTYADELVKTLKGWRFKRRVASIDAAVELVPAAPANLH